VIWALSPLYLLVDPSLFGRYSPEPGWQSFVERTSMLWLWVGGAALLFRTAQLFFIRDVQTGVVWLTKIITDPFHDLKLYHRAPLAVMRGELLEPAGARAGSAGGSH